MKTLASLLLIVFLLAGCNNKSIDKKTADKIIKDFAEEVKTGKIKPDSNSQDQFKSICNKYKIDLKDWNEYIKNNPEEQTRIVQTMQKAMMGKTQLPTANPQTPTMSKQTDKPKTQTQVQPKTSDVVASFDWAKFITGFQKAIMSLPQDKQVKFMQKMGELKVLQKMSKLSTKTNSSKDMLKVYKEMLSEIKSFNVDVSKLEKMLALLDTTQKTQISKSKPTTNQQLKLSASDFPKDWVLKNNVQASDAQVKNFSSSFGVPISKVNNLLFNMGNEKIQVNTMLCDNPNDANTLFNRMVKKVGTSNTVLKKGLGVIEVISKNPDHVKKVTELVKPDNR